MANQRIPLSYRSKNILKSIKGGSDQTDLELLLTHFELYLDQVFRTSISEKALNIAPHPLFSYQSHPASLELARELDYRLDLLSAYSLSKSDRIVDLLSAGLIIQQPISFSRLQVEFIQLLAKHPRIGNVALAKKLAISPRTVKQLYRELFLQKGIRRAGIIDPHHFGLVHFGVRFQTKSIKATYRFEELLRNIDFRSKNFPFILGYGFDVNQLDGFLSVFVPNQRSFLAGFEKTLSSLQGQFFDFYEIHHILGFYSNVSFDCYDHISRQWRITSDLRTEGIFRFIEEHGPQFIPLSGFEYHQQDISYNQIDWLLALSICEGLLSKQERNKLLASHGFQLSSKTIWAHEQRLVKDKTLFPYLAFSRLAFDDIICIIINCEESMLETLHQLLAQYPFSRLAPTKQGAIMFIGMPISGSSLLKQLTRTLLIIPGLTHVSILRFKRDLPQIPLIQTFKLKKSKTNQWIEAVNKEEKGDATSATQ